MVKKNSGYEIRKVSLAVFIFVVLFFYLPLLVLVIFSFNSGKSMHWTGFSLKWYQQLFLHSGNLWLAVLNSFIVALTSSICATALGTLGGIGLYWYNFKWKKYLRIISYLPLIMPEIIIGVSLLILFAGMKWKMSLFTVFIAHTTFNIPYVIMIVISRLEEFDFSIIEAAYDLGAKELDTLFRVILPLTFPAVVSGLLMSVTLSLDDFIVTFFVSGPGSSTLPFYIYSMINRGAFPIINTLSTVIIAFTVLAAVSSRKVHKYLFH